MGHPTVNAAESAPKAHAVRALDGLRVLDFSAMMAGPYCARWLADLGADVIKVEPLEGDHMRLRAPLRDGHSSYFGHLNSGKRCIALDLKQPEAVGIALRLARQSDILIQSFRPGVMQRLGLGPKAVREFNPALIYCSISGFGHDGSMANRPAYAPVVHASSGYYMAQFDAQNGTDRPPNSSIPMADMVTAVFAALSIQTALLERARSGHGAELEVNLMDSIVNVMAFEFQAAQFPQHNARPRYRPLRASDGFVLVAPINGRNFRTLCAATGHPEWVGDVLFATDAARFAHWDELMRRVEGWTCERAAADCEAVLVAAGVPCARYRGIEEAMRDPQFEQRDSFATVHDEAGDYLTTHLPFSIDGRKPATGRRVAALGGDTTDVLTGLLGLDASQLAQLRRDGTIAGH